MAGIGKTMITTWEYGRVGVRGGESSSYVVQRAGKGESSRRVLHTTSETTVE